MKVITLWVLWELYDIKLKEHTLLDLLYLEDIIASSLIVIVIQKSRIRETLNLSTVADCSTNTIKLVS